MASAPNPTKLVALAARGLAGLDDEDLRGNRLNLELEVSVWLRRSGVELGTVPRALLALRRALLDVSALERSSEPVPLVIADDQLAVESLCVYLHGLIARGAESTDLGRPDFVEAALSHLGTVSADARLSS